MIVKKKKFWLMRFDSKCERYPERSEREKKIESVFLGHENRFKMIGKLSRAGISEKKIELFSGRRLD